MKIHPFSPLILTALFGTTIGYGLDIVHIAKPTNKDISLGIIHDASLTAGINAGRNSLA
jgi:hypothetical protein